MSLRATSLGFAALLWMGASCGDSARVDNAHDAGDMHDAARPIEAGTDAASEPPLFPCVESTPVASGLERCNPSGYLRRVGPATCTSSLPRQLMPQSIYPELDQCADDSECAHLHLGHCDRRQDGNTLVCIAGCETDEDCSEGSVCFCGEAGEAPVGRCVPAACDSSADCEAGYECRLYDAAPGCPSVRFECQTPDDSCAVSCAGFSPNPSFCVWGGGAFGCSIAQCTQP